MTAAWEFLASLEKHESVFAKIPYDKEATACLNRGNFTLHMSEMLLLNGHLQLHVPPHEYVHARAAARSVTEYFRRVFRDNKTARIYLEHG